MCIYVGVHVFECICEYSALQADRVAAQRRTGAKRFAFFMPGLPRQLLKIFTCYLWGTHALGNEHANPASRTFLPLLSASICRFPSFSLTFSASYVLYLLIIQLLLPSLSFFSHHKKYSLVRARQSPGVFNEIFSLILQSLNLRSRYYDLYLPSQEDGRMIRGERKKGKKVRIKFVEFISRPVDLLHLTSTFRDLAIFWHC